MINAISPIDGRYHSKTKSLIPFFSEAALIKYRVVVELKYFKRLANSIPQLSISSETEEYFDEIISSFSDSDAEHIKTIERTTNHDVKAVEYFIKEKFDAHGLEEVKEFVHFGLTSQDINNTATPMIIRDALHSVAIPAYKNIIQLIQKKATEYKGIPMLAKTHGQPASPTTLGKEMMVFVERLNDQVNMLTSLPVKAKFGGATGNMNAHKVTYPEIDWIAFANDFVSKDLGLVRSQYTTQIAHYDHLAAIFDCLERINTILIDFCRDIWTYISMEYFRQKVVKGEIGSSAMPHKVNPIDFENAEGNLGLANAIFGHLSSKLPISRLQRDLTDSTVLRNVGVPFGHSLIACTSIEKGMSKLLLNESKLQKDLDNNWAVVAEAIQNILRREGYDKPYEALLNLTRGKASITKTDIHDFIQELNVSDHVKEEMQVITPFNYIGYF